MERSICYKQGRVIVRPGYIELQINPIWCKLLHHIPYYSDVIVREMASQIASVSIVCYLFRPGLRKPSKLRVTGLCEGNQLGTGGFPYKCQQSGKYFRLMLPSWYCSHILYFLKRRHPLRLNILIQRSCNGGLVGKLALDGSQHI